MEIYMNDNDDELTFDNTSDDEVDEFDIDQDKRQIFTDQGDPEIESLYGKHKRGKLIIQPDFQRQFVWDNAKSCRLIESALLDIPLPVVYISQETDGKEYIIDGQQRLTAFFSFIDGTYPDGKVFKLKGLKVFKELNGKRFNDLPEGKQDVIRYCKLRTITFKKESDPELKFEIFERLNTGSVSLNDQELRNCIYRGPFNILLKELSSDNEFMGLVGLTMKDKRMKDVELVLRFSAFYHQTYLNYKPPIRKFLNVEMDRFRDISDKDANDLQCAFRNSVQIIKSLFGKNAFKRFYKGTNDDKNGYWEQNKFNASLYDIMMYSFATIDKNIIFQHLDEIREALLDLMTSDQDFIDSIELSTSSLQAVTFRFDKWRSTLQKIIGIQQKEERCFSHKLKQELFKQDSTCKICEQAIQEIDDSALDHIHQYWQGGKTVPENARLTHRYCNSSRPRNEQ